MALDDPSPTPELRRITDTQSLRALSHPVRIAIIEALTLDGPLTATEVGDRISESPTTCSFHLRQLAKYGFVEEAGGGKGRARPWRMTSIGMSLGATEGDVESELAHHALSQLLRERNLERYQRWLASKTSYPKAWRDAANESEYVFYLTAEELHQLNQEVSDLLLAKFRERLDDPAKRPAGAIPVEMQVIAYPVGAPGQGRVD